MVIEIPKCTIMQTENKSASTPNIFSHDLSKKINQKYIQSSDRQ